MVMRIDFEKVRKGGRCAVAIGYDIDMPGDLEYLYNKDLGWRGGCHGHLNEEVLNYVHMLARVAEDCDARLQFFLQGNTLEDPVEPWIEIVKRGHAVDQHSYTHLSLIHAPLDKVESELSKTKRSLEEKLKIVSVGLRGPGGYLYGLHGREEVQRLILKTGIRWVSTEYPFHTDAPEELFHPRNEERTIQMIPCVQPYYYDSGLLEIPIGCYQDRSFFDVDMDGDPRRPVEDWIAYLKRAVDFVYEQRLVLSLTVHPSTSFKHDPKGEYIKEILSYCTQKPGTLIGTYRDIYQLVKRYGRPL